MWTKLISKKWFSELIGMALVSWMYFGMDKSVGTWVAYLSFMGGAIGIHGAVDVIDKKNGQSH